MRFLFIALSLWFPLSVMAQASTPPSLSQKIIGQGVPSDAVTRLFKFIQDNKDRDFIQDTYICLGKAFGTLKACDDSLRVRDQQTVRFSAPAYTAIIDFTRPSTERRFFLINMNTGEVKKYYTAHGKGSGEKYAFKFSNVKDSKQTSLGVYVAGETYAGNYGATLRMYGLERSNDQAYNRDIVMHGAWYVGEDFINSINDQTHQKYGRLGVSWGCPALSLEIAPQVIALLKNGGLILHYHKDLMDPAQSGQEVSVPDPALTEVKPPAEIPLPPPRPASI